VIRRLTTTLLLGLALLGLAEGRIAAADGDAEAIGVAGVAVDGGLLTIGVSVVDSSQVPVEDLTPTDFRVEIDGIPAATQSVASGEDSSVPLSLVLVVDTSGSMAGQPLAAAKEALTQFADSVRPIDRLALITFDDAVQEVVGLSSDRAALRAAINALEARGNTALYDAVDRAVALALSTSEARRGVVFLADGEDFGGVSSASREAALEAAAASGIPFYVVGLGQELDAAFLEALAVGGGGRYLEASSPDQLSALYSEISAALRLQYALTVPIPDGIAFGDMPVVVSVGGATGSGRVTIAAPSTPVQPSIHGVPANLTSAATVAVTGVAPGTTVEWTLDGEPFAPTGGEYRLDPYLLTPGEHQLAAVITADSQPTLLQAHFMVPSLPPLLVSPVDLPPLRAGDVLLLTLASQHQPVTARYVVDGEVAQVDEGPPYRFVVPRTSAADAVQLEIQLGDAGGTSSYVYDVEPPASPGTSRTVLIGGAIAVLLLAAGAAAIGWFGVRPWLQQRHEREEEPRFDGLGPAFDRWATVRGQQPPEAPEAPEAQPAAPILGAAQGAWGRIAVIDGPDRGAEFELTDEAELAGRGRFCSIRLRDRSVKPAHLLINRDGTYRVSAPGLAVEVDGATAATGKLGDGSKIRIGSTLLHFKAEPR